MLNHLLRLFCPEYGLKILNIIIKTLGELLSYFREYVRDESAYNAAIDAVIELLIHMKDNNDTPTETVN
ncbi:MAG: hypothetical protein RSB82_02030 [Victivallaceae bacterium]